MTNNSDFVVWDTANVRHACVLAELNDVPDDYELRKGVPRFEGWSSDANLTMDPEYPRDTLLVDNLQNSRSLIVASGAIRAFLEARTIPKVEYLRVTIINHKNRPASEDYYIIHPIEPVDCLNIEESGVRWSKIDKTVINKVKQLVIEESKVPSERQIFRMKSFHKVVLVRRALAEAMDAEGFKGNRWTELDEYGL